MFRIGIYYKSEEPYTDLSCYGAKLETESSWHQISRCSKPGFSMEALQMLLMMLEVPLERSEFVLAYGYSTTKDKTGLVDLVEDGRVNLTVPQLAITSTRFERVNFATPFELTPGPCFLICSRNGFVRIPYFAAFSILVGPYGSIAVGTILSLAFLAVARWLHRTFRGNRGINCSQFWKSLVDSFLSRPGENSAIEVFHARFFTTLIVLVFLKGIVKSGLLKSFTPFREFPFSSIDGIADAVGRGEWSIGSLSPTSTHYKFLMSLPQFKSIARRFSARGRKFEDSVTFLSTPGVNREQALLQNEKLAFFHGTANVHSFLARTKSNLDCKCQPLRKGSMIMGSSGISHQATDLQESVNYAILRMHEIGYLEKLQRKYRIHNEETVDSQQLMNAGLRKVPRPTSLPLSAVLTILIAYGVTLLSAAVCLLTEFLSQSSSVSPHR